MLQELCHCDNEMQTDNAHSEEDNSKNTEDMDENEVRMSLSHFINRCLLLSSLQRIPAKMMTTINEISQARYPEPLATSSEYCFYSEQ